MAEIYEHNPALDLVNRGADLEEVQAAAAGCRACDLWQNATQTVFGDGPAGAAVMLVGEQPGDQEDMDGEPFVGPAGRLLDRALDRSGIERSQTYVTNVVKHFKWEPRGKRRIHRKPNAEQIRACEPWLRSEIELVKPRVVVCLGATAAQALLGRDFRVTELRGRIVEWDLEPMAAATVHPSSILRARDAESRKREMDLFVKDLSAIARALE